MDDRFDIILKAACLGILGIFVVLVIIGNPGVAWPIGVILGLAICYVMVKDDIIVIRERRRIDREHEAL